MKKITKTIAKIEWSGKIARQFLWVKNLYFEINYYFLLLYYVNYCVKCGFFKWMDLMKMNI